MCSLISRRSGGASVKSPNELPGWTTYPRTAPKTINGQNGKPTGVWNPPIPTRTHALIWVLLLRPIRCHFGLATEGDSWKNSKRSNHYRLLLESSSVIFAAHSKYRFSFPLRPKRLDIYGIPAVIYLRTWGQSGVFSYSPKVVTESNP